ncbi:tripartite tricarboxylate transporter substrate binding protein [Roseomonas nepalensis]|uniref:Tripartite tricarboxylate transporter substrate binding protein n=1 Tax=Muricoccus nepalensis TaxID=1854500 RepID=A0A502EKX9_9PROT|nr:tripartite tricarboxylate transporter substrate-binding protein [Roseomonas nepalensis]TPG37729.1 tripartite tricarboxylate transporter substrate binding protein [Roseomonas nepalensis]
MRHRIPRRSALRATGSLLGAALAAPALAQGPAARPVTVVVPYSAGSPPDLVARLLAEGLARRTGQPYVVDNRTGASGNIGTAAVARAAPDGATLLVQTNTLAMNVSLFRNLPYDPLASFTPVVELATAGFGLLLHPTGGADVAEFVARARARPGRLNYGSPGIGTPHHLAMELFRQQAGIEVAHVPYRNLAGAVTDLLAGRIAAMFVSAGAAQGLAGESRVRLVAVAAPSRLPTFPEAPTLAETGLPATDMSGWYGLFAPAGLPPDALARLNAAANEVLADPEVAAALTAQGITPVGGAPDRLRALVAADATRWADVVRMAGIAPE